MAASDSAGLELTMYEIASFLTPHLVGRVLVGILCVGGVACDPRSGAETAAQPDFAPNSGVGWVAFSTTFMSPPSGPGPVKDDPAHHGATNDEFRTSGRQATFPIADLNNPILQPWVRERLQRRNEQILAGDPAFTWRASCWPMGVPGFLLYPVQPVYIIQSPTKVIMIWQADHQVRHIYLQENHSPEVKTSWYGESIGHYEGDTLVVDTIGLDPRSFIDDFGTPHTDKLHVIERIRLIDRGMTLEVSVHVEDSGAFTTPWNAIQRYRRLEPGKAENADPFSPVLSSSRAGPMLEARCAENPMPVSGARPIPQANEPDF